MCECVIGCGINFAKKVGKVKHFTESGCSPKAKRTAPNWKFVAAKAETIRSS